MAPLVSFIVITHNRRAELSRCLAHLQAQTFPHSEILVVDNGSTDGTPGMLQSEFPAVRLVALENNYGVSGGRNRGAQAAAGEICIFIDDDADLLSPAATERVVEYFRADQRLACLALTVLSQRTGVEDPKSIPRADKRPPSGDYEATYFCGAGFVMRRKVFLEAGMFWEPLVYGSQELDLAYRLLDRGYRILHTRQVEVLHHEVPSSRPAGQWVYFNARDRCWVAIRNLPWRHVASTSLLWWAYTAVTGLKRGELRHFLRGFLAALSGLPQALSGRKPIGRHAQGVLKTASGRLWY